MGGHSGKAGRTAVRELSIITSVNFSFMLYDSRLKCGNSEANPKNCHFFPFGPLIFERKYERGRKLQGKDDEDGRIQDRSEKAVQQAPSALDGRVLVRLHDMDLRDYAAPAGNGAVRFLYVHRGFCGDDRECCRIHDEQRPGKDPVRDAEQDADGDQHRHKREWKT